MKFIAQTGNPTQHSVDYNVTLDALLNAGYTPITISVGSDGHSESGSLSLIKCAGTIATCAKQPTSLEHLGVDLVWRRDSLGNITIGGLHSVRAEPSGMSCSPAQRVDLSPEMAKNLRKVIQSVKPGEFSVELAPQNPSKWFCGMG